MAERDTIKYRAGHKSLTSVVAFQDIIDRRIRPLSDAQDAMVSNRPGYNSIINEAVLVIVFRSSIFVASYQRYSVYILHTVGRTRNYDNVGREFTNHKSFGPGIKISAPADSL